MAGLTSATALLLLASAGATPEPEAVFPLHFRESAVVTDARRLGTGAHGRDQIELRRNERRWTAEVNDEAVVQTPDGAEPQLEGLQVQSATQAMQQKQIADKEREKAEQSAKLAAQQKAVAEANARLAEARFQLSREAVDRYFTEVSENTLLDEPGLEPCKLCDPLGAE